MCCIYMCILSVELVHAIHSCSSFIHSETGCEYACAVRRLRVAIDRPVGYNSLCPLLRVSFIGEFCKIHS